MNERGRERTKKVLSMMRLLGRVTDLVTRPLEVLLLSAAMRLWPTARVDGFQIVTLAGPASELAEVAEPIKNALRVIREHAPRRFARLRLDVRRFVVVSVTGPEYIPSIRACMLSGSYVKTSTAESLAMTIVHEATHARLSAVGIRYTPGMRDRIERRCVREEVAFAEALPDGEELATRALAKLENPWWSEEQELERRISQLRELGRPEWYISVYRRIRSTS